MNLFEKPFQFLPHQPVQVLQKRISRRNAHLLLNLSTIFIMFLTLYASLFHFFMYLENRSYSLFTGVYWTFTTVTTLGLGDITFNSDVGKIFNVFVLVTGVIFILLIIPFAFVQLFQSSERVPHELSINTKGHVIITHRGAITSSLIQLLQNYHIPYILIISDLKEALNLIDQGYKVVLGNIDDPQTYRNCHADQAALVATTSLDETNAGVIYAVRTISDKIPLLATATNVTSFELLKIAGCSEIMLINKILGKSLARRVVGGDAMAHVIGEINDILIAEAATAGTPMVGKTIHDIDLQELIGAKVIGIWKKGKFQTASSGEVITNQATLVLAGTKEQIEIYNEMFCIYKSVTAPVLIVGGGIVGVTMANELIKKGINYRIIDKDASLIKKNENYCHADAAIKETLIKAGIKEAPTIAITTHDDNINMYISTLSRYLNPDIQIIGRATKQRAIQLLHKAGCDFVMSYASLGAHSIFNYLKNEKILMVAEGVDVFKVSVPASLAGKKIVNTKIRENTGCSIIGIVNEDHMDIKPPSTRVLKENSEIVLIGTVESEIKFLHTFI